jgi:hypothetical protein
MQKILCAVVATTMLIVAGTSLAYAGEIEKKINLKDVPQKIIDSAKDKVKGIEFKEAEVEIEQIYKEYKLKGTANGKKYKIKVGVDKEENIIKVKVEKEEEEDDDDDDDDDEKDK